jgi:hypothetical protein
VGQGDRGEIISSTNKSLSRRSRTVSILVFLSFAAMNTISFFGNVQSFRWTIINFAITISIAVLFYFNSYIRNLIFVPIMTKYSWSLLRKNLGNVGINAEDFNDRIHLKATGFEFTPE